MHTFLLIMSLTLTASATDWQKVYSKAVEQAKETKKPILIDFYADWCGPCKKMAETTLQSDIVLSELKNFILLKIDIDKEPKLSIKFNVSSIPHFIILNRHGEIVSELKGYSNPTNFSEWISINKQQAFSENKLDELSVADKALVASLNTQPIKSMQKFITLYKQSPMAKKDSLLKLSKSVDTSKFFRCLQHKSLEVRLYATQLIAASQKEPFLFDPWAPLKIRELQLSKLKGKY